MKIKLAENLQMLRKEKKLTQEEIANVFGVTSQSVSKWELGLACPDITLLPEIANYFEVSVDELLGNKPSSSLNSLYLNMKSLFEKEKSQSEKHELVYKVSILASTLLDKHEGDYAQQIISGKKYRNITVHQCENGFSCKGNNTLFITSFKDFPDFDNTTIRKVHKYLTTINKVNTLKVLFAMFKLVLDNGIKKSYSMEELIELTGISENNLWLAFNDLNISAEYDKDGKELWYLTCINEVPMLISLMIPQLIEFDPNNGRLKYKK